MATRMSTAKFLSMGDRRVGDHNDELLERARVVINSSPEPRFAIAQYDQQLDMKEKERLGINFNRSVTMSLTSRWEVVNKLTVEFLEEVVNLNDQLTDEASKQAKQLLALILTRTQRLGIASRIEQMGGLLMHITFYRSVLRAKITELGEASSFLMHCADLMSFHTTSQVMDRYTALKFTLNEIADEREKRLALLDKLQDKQQQIAEQSLKESIVLYNKMALLHERLKEVRAEAAEMERFIEYREQHEAESELELKSIKGGIHACYTNVMNYRGIDARKTDPLLQMEEMGTRLTVTLSAVRMVEEQGWAERDPVPHGGADVTKQGKDPHHQPKKRKQSSKGGNKISRNTTDTGSDDDDADSVISWDLDNKSSNRCRDGSRNNEENLKSSRGGAEGNMSSNRFGALEESSAPNADSCFVATETLKSVHGKAKDITEESSWKSALLSAVPSATAVSPGESTARGSPNRLKKGLSLQRFSSSLHPKVQALRGRSAGYRSACSSSVPCKLTAMLPAHVAAKAWNACSGSVCDIIHQHLRGFRKEDAPRQNTKGSISKRGPDDATTAKQIAIDESPSKVYSKTLRRTPSLPSGPSSGQVNHDRYNRSCNRSEQALHVSSLKPTSDGVRALTKRLASLKEVSASGVIGRTSWSPRGSMRSERLDTFASNRSIPGSLRSGSFRTPNRVPSRITEVNRMRCICHTETVGRKDPLWPGSGFWDDGVFIPAKSDGGTKKAKIRTRKGNKANAVKTDSLPVADTAVESSGFKRDGGNCKAMPAEVSSSGLKSGIDVSNRDVLQPVSTSSGMKSMANAASNEPLINDVGSLQKTTWPLDTKKMYSKSLRPNIQTLGKRHSTGSLGGSLRLKPLKTHNSEPTIKTSLRKPGPSDATTGADRTGEKRSVRFQPYRKAPPLSRRPHLLNTYQSGQTNNTSSHSPAVAQNTQYEHNPKRLKVLRKLNRARELRNNCLAILAGVNLGSRLPEEQMPNDWSDLQ